MPYKCVVKKVYYADSDSDFFIFLAQDLNGNSTRKIKGNFFQPRIHPGVEVEILEAKWESSPRYGKTYVATKAQPLLDSKTSQMKMLKLACPMLSGTDLSSVLSYFDSVPDSFLDFMDDPSNRLLEVLSDSKAAIANASWRQYRSYAYAANALHDLGLSPSKIKSIYAELGDETVAIVKNNPYALALSSSISFPQADKIALRQGLSQDSKSRIASILEYLLECASRKQGDMYVLHGDLLTLLNRLPRKEKVPTYGRTLSKADLNEALEDRVKKGRLVVDEDRVYLSKNFDYEMNCAQRLHDLSSSADLDVDVASFSKDYERIHGISFSSQQRAALDAISQNKVLLLTGLPGTGKSTVTKAILRLFQKASKAVTLMAPTGIAAKRLSTVTGHKAGTIHRTLGFSVNGTWRFDHRNQFVTDVVLVDEVSMVDQKLFYHLLQALPDTTALVLVGDDAQLPSVGAGNVLHELIRSQSIPRVHLTEIFRQDSASDIVLNAHRINQGQELLIKDPKDADTDFRFLHKDDPEDIMAGVLYIVKKLYEKHDKSTYQVISPTYKGPLGVDRLNDEIKALLNPDVHQQEVTIRGQSMREDDRIMIVQNNYQLELYNGEIGKLQKIDRKEKKIQLKIFDEPMPRIVDMSYAQAGTLTTLAYALTTHRCQGNEFDYVILPFHKMFSIQLQRNLLYTAITRAKKKVFVLGQWQALCRAIANDSVSQRNTHFAERIKELFDDKVVLIP